MMDWIVEGARKAYKIENPNKIVKSYQTARHWNSDTLAEHFCALRSCKNTNFQSNSNGKPLGCIE